MTTATDTNAYWDAVQHQLADDDHWGPCVGSLPYIKRGELLRHDMTSLYSWTVTDPATVAFVAGHCGPRVLDPLAGSGWWAFLLGKLGVDVLASDAALPGEPENVWHTEGVLHCPVDRADAIQAASERGSGRTLLLSWPPYGSDIGERLLAARAWSRVVYVGEGPGGCCGDDGMFEAFAVGFVEVARHQPVQWWGLHDEVVVYDRSGGVS